MRKSYTTLTEIHRITGLIICVCLLMSPSTLNITKCYAQNVSCSWYSRASLIREGTWKNGKEKRMANGKQFDETKFTCATRMYPLGAILKITYAGKVVQCEVTDRIGQRFATTRIDLSKTAFAVLAPLKQGIIPCVKIERIK